VDDPLPSVDIVIKTFMRPACLRRLVDSITARYPGAPLNIADDSELDEDTASYYAGLERQGHQVVLLPFNVGVSAGRNALVDRTSRPYLLLLDDDRVFTEDTSLEALLDVLQADPSIGVAAGSSVDNGTDLVSYEHNLRVKHRLVHYYPVGPATTPIGGHPCRVAQGVHNFALFRREVFATTRWDDELKSMEHTDFFLRLSRTPWKVVHVSDVSVAHFHESPPGYDAFRYDRANNERGEKKWDIIGSVYHTDNARSDRRLARRIYAKSALASLRERKIRIAASTLASALLAELQ
jgi:GT2 family glycosyltransferase